MFAVIELQGHQYIVREGDTIVVDKLELESSTFVADKVLLTAEEDGSSTVVGKPYVANTTVTFDVVTDFQKGEKIRVLKFKRKNRYQRIIGFRPFQTVLLVTAIGAGAKPAKKAEKTANLETAVTESAPKNTEAKPAKEAKAAKPAADKAPAKKAEAKAEKPVAKKVEKAVKAAAKPKAK